MLAADKGRREASITQRLVRNRARVTLTLALSLALSLTLALALTRALSREARITQGLREVGCGTMVVAEDERLGRGRLRVRGAQG